MARQHRYTLSDIRRRKAEVARQIAAEKAGVQQEISRLTSPSTLVSALMPWEGFKTAFKIASQAVYAYRMVSSVASLFRKNRR